MAFIVFPASLTTTLSAVNTMLASLGESPLSSITPPPTSEAQEALDRLDEMDLNVQTEGWSWNRETDFPLTVDVDGHLVLPDMTLRAVPSPSETSFNVVDRGGKLYDRTNHTFVFPAGTTLKADLIVRLDWDSLPQVARAYILYVATQAFHAGKQGSSVVLNVNAQDVSRARATLQQYDDTVDPQNAVTGNLGVASALSGVAGMRRNRQGFR